jgi:hypothetical protein
MLMQHFLERLVQIRLAGFQVHGLNLASAGQTTMSARKSRMCRLRTAEMEGEEEDSVRPNSLLLAQYQDKRSSKKKKKKKPPARVEYLKYLYFHEIASMLGFLYLNCVPISECMKFRFHLAITAKIPPSYPSQTAWLQAKYQSYLSSRQSYPGY